jgi:hypothetical protein
MLGLVCAIALLPEDDAPPVESDATFAESDAKVID